MFYITCILHVKASNGLNLIGNYCITFLYYGKIQSSTVSSLVLCNTDNTAFKKVYTPIIICNKQITTTNKTFFNFIV